MKLKVQLNQSSVIEMTRKFRGAKTHGPVEFAAAIYAEEQIEAKEVQRRTPVDTGNLSSTVKAIEPVMMSWGIESGVQAGDDSTPYALIVHEDPDANHPVGQWKYLESVVNESRPYIMGRIARRIDLRRVMRG